MAHSCHWDLWNVGTHALQPSHNWSKLFGALTPTLADIRSYLEEALRNGTWRSVGFAFGLGGQVIGERLETDAIVGGHTIWVRGFRRNSDGKIIVNNSGVR